MKIKKLVLLTVLSVFGIIPVYADPTPTPRPTPVPAVNTDPTLISLGSQVDAFLATEGQGVTEFTTRGVSKLETLDGLVGIGKYKANVVAPYYVVIDGGVIQNSVNTGNIGVTFGAHANVFQFIGSFLTLSPSAQTFWSYLNLTPRVSFDSDVHQVVYGEIGRASC